MSVSPSAFATAAVVAAFASSPTVSAAQSGAPAPEARPRSVLFYVIDTCRSDRMGFDGYARGTTPFLDRIAERAVVFESCSSQAPWTKPSMASMLTSQYPSKTGIYRMDQRLPEEFVTWPEVLRASGRTTVGFSANIVMGNSLSNYAQGFDHFTESTDVNRGDPIRFASGSAKLLNEHVFAWLDAHDAWPMLLYVHSVDPHEEYEPEPGYLERFADPARHPQYREEWQRLLASRPPIPGLYVTQDNFDRTGVDAASFVSHGSDLYDADLSANDDQLERLWERLQEEGWGEDFVFVFTSDHGEEFFEHGGTSHGYSLYEEMVHVPLMIWAPGLLPEGVRIDAPVRSLDIYPTLCDLLGIAVPEGLAGASLLPLIEGRADAAPRTIVSEHREDPVLRRLGQGSGVLVSLREGRWKFLLNQTGSQLLEKPRFELYDLEQDPHERVNVAEQHPDLVRRFELAVATFVADHRAGASASDWVAPDPAVLTQLRELGYIGQEEAAPDLWDALDARDVGRVRAALEAGADANERDEAFGVLPLSMAAMRGDLALARVLLAGGATVDARNTDGSTPLMGAAFLGRPEMLTLLLERGADPAARNTIGGDARAAAMAPWDVTAAIAGLLGVEVAREEVEAGRQECVRRLSAGAATVDESTARLFAAVASGDLAAVEAALAAGASLKDWQPSSGRTPLYEAVALGNEALARLLLDRGASVHARTRDMEAPLHGAAQTDDAALAGLLLERGADVDVRDPRGDTPLHMAAFLGHARAAEVLLRAGADPRMRDEGGRTALDLTAIDWPTTEQVLRQLGLALEREAVEAGRVEIARLLVR